MNGNKLLRQVTPTAAACNDWRHLCKPPEPSLEPTTNLPPSVFDPTILITSCKQVYWPWGGTTFSSPFISTLILSRMAPDTADLSVLLSVTRKHNTSSREEMKGLWNGQIKATKWNISNTSSFFFPFFDRAWEPLKDVFLFGFFLGFFSRRCVLLSTRKRWGCHILQRAQMILQINTHTQHLNFNYFAL